MFLFTAFSPSFVANIPNNAAKAIVEEIFTTTDWKGTARQINLDMHVNVENEAKTMQQKTLIMGCQHDSIVPISHSENLLNIIPNATLIQLNTGHGGVTENPAAFIQLLDTFLK